MRSFGIVLVVCGVLGFFYCGDQAKRFDPVPEETGWRKGLEYPAGQWEAARYACAMGSAIGLLLSIVPKGR